MPPASGGLHANARGFVARERRLCVRGPYRSVADRDAPGSPRRLLRRADLDRLRDPIELRIHSRQLPEPAVSDPDRRRRRPRFRSGCASRARSSPWPRACPGSTRVSVRSSRLPTQIEPRPTATGPAYPDGHLGHDLVRLRVDDPEWFGRTTLRPLAGRGPAESPIATSHNRDGATAAESSAGATRWAAPPRSFGELGLAPQRRERSR